MRIAIAMTAAVLAWVLGAVTAHAQSPFAATVIAFNPAPGQFVNNSSFNDPSRALGPPVGGGLSTPSNSSVVSLGGFGGSITLGFDHAVENDPRNPLGLDFIVYGNAFFPGGNPGVRFAEPAHIEISRDANGNGLADDPWYLIPGSHAPALPGPPGEVTWDRDTTDATFPPAAASWIPPGLPPPPYQWTTHAHTPPPGSPFDAGPVVPNPNGPESMVEGVWGYADCSPTLVLGDTDGDGTPDDETLSPEEFYTLPDDPLTVGIAPIEPAPYAGGGDAFDIAWAIDPATGLPANLTEFHFIRITTAVYAVTFPFGETSAEIDAIADVRPLLAASDIDHDGDTDVADIFAYLALWFANDPAADFTGDALVGVDDIFAFLAAWFAGE